MYIPKVDFKSYVKQNDNIGTDLLKDFYNNYGGYPANIRDLKYHLDCYDLWDKEHLREAFYFLKYSLKPCLYDLYFLKSNKMNLIKIGKTADFNKRLLVLEKKWGDLDMVVVGEGLGYLENYLHKKFKKYNKTIFDQNNKKSREWFSLDILNNKEFEEFLKLNK